jgi:hypothetical protein
MGQHGDRGDEPAGQTEHPQVPEEPGHTDQHDSPHPGNGGDHGTDDQHDAPHTGNGGDHGSYDQQDTPHPGDGEQHDTPHTGNGDNHGTDEQHDAPHTGNGGDQHDTPHPANGDTGRTGGEGTLTESGSQDINIVDWPPTLSLEHKTDPNATPKLSVGLESSPVQMNMDISNSNPFKVCIQLCEPIAVKSSYTIAIDVFDRPVASITLNGTTTIYNSPEEQ